MVHVDFAARVAKPHIVVYRFELFFKILCRSQVFVVFVFRQFVHLGVAVWAYTPFVAAIVHRSEQHNQCRQCHAESEECGADAQ